MVGRKSLALALAVAGISAPALGLSVPALAWDGPYAGASGGGAWGPQSQTGGRIMISHYPSIVTVTGDASYGLAGGLVGGTVGYNFQNGRYVAGLEGDGSWASITGSGTCSLGTRIAHGCGGAVDALGTVRGRLGYDLGVIAPPFGSVLAYATGGLAVGDVYAWDSYLGTSGSKTVAGWTVGGGLEAMLGTTNWSVKLEYLYVDLGNPAVFSAVPPMPEHVSTQFSIVRAGFNYNFDWGPPPAVTK